MITQLRDIIILLGAIIVALIFGLSFLAAFIIDIFEELENKRDRRNRKEGILCRTDTLVIWAILASLDC